MENSPLQESINFLAPNLIDYSSVFNNKVNLFLTQIDDYWDKEYPHLRRDKIKELFNLKDLKIITPKQIHSDIVVDISDKAEDPECDSIIFNSNNIIGSINVADCVPICIYDIDKETVSLTHSGWKGTAKKIVIKTIKKLQKMGSNKKSLRFFLGPSIKSCCYEVENSFALQFDSIAIRKQDEKYFVDLPSQIKFDLEKEGISSSSIIVSNRCTFDDKTCHSFRRDGEAAGRMSFIAYKGVK